MPLRGFTLAEVLITIGILGVVAAMTIPTLMQNSQNKEMVSKYLKMHNTLANAFKTTEALLGSGVQKLDGDTFKSEFQDNLKTISCEVNKICLPDGSYYEYKTAFNNDCPDDVCMELSIDTNGEKGPNQTGKDQFTLQVTPKGIRGLGNGTECDSVDCGGYILANHKLFDGESSNSSADFSTCEASGAATCTLADGSTAKKVSVRFNPYSDELTDVYISQTIPAGSYDPVGTIVLQGKGWSQEVPDYQAGARKVCEDLGMSLPYGSQTLWKIARDANDPSLDGIYYTQTDPGICTSGSCTAGSGVTGPRNVVCVSGEPD